MDSKTVGRGLECQTTRYNSECLTLGVCGGYISVTHGPQGKSLMVKRGGFSEVSVIREKLFRSLSDSGDLCTDDKDSSSSSSDYLSALSSISQEDGESGKVKVLPRILATFNERQEVHTEGPTQLEPEVEATLEQSTEYTDNIQMFFQEFSTLTKPRPTLTKPERPKPEKNKFCSGCCNFL